MNVSTINFHHLPTPTTARVVMLIYWRVKQKVCYWISISPKKNSIGGTINPFPVERWHGDREEPRHDFFILPECSHSIPPLFETWVLYWIHSFWGGGDIWQNRRMRILSAIRRRGLVRWISPMHCPRWLGASKLVAPFLPNLRSTRPQKFNIPNRYHMIPYPQWRASTTIF